MEDSPEMESSHRATRDFVASVLVVTVADGLAHNLVETGMTHTEALGVLDRMCAALRDRDKYKAMERWGALFESLSYCGRVRLMDGLYLLIRNAIALGEGVVDSEVLNGLSKGLQGMDVEWLAQAQVLYGDPSAVFGLAWDAVSELVGGRDGKI